MNACPHFCKTKSALTPSINHTSRQIPVRFGQRVAIKIAGTRITIECAGGPYVIFPLSGNLCSRIRQDIPGFQFRDEISSLLWVVPTISTGVTVSYSSHAWDSPSSSISPIRRVLSLVSVRDPPCRTCPERTSGFLRATSWRFRVERGFRLFGVFTLTRLINSLLPSSFSTLSSIILGKFEQLEIDQSLIFIW